MKFPRRILPTGETLPRQVTSLRFAKNPAPSTAESDGLATAVQAVQRGGVAKKASVTVHKPTRLRKSLEVRARGKKRSLSAQVEHELPRAIAIEREPRRVKTGTLLGRFSDALVPSDEDIDEIRALMWTRLRMR